MGSIGVNGPDASNMIGRTGRKMAYVRAEKDAGYVGVMRLERGDGDQGCDISILYHAPNVHLALEIKSRWSDSFPHPPKVREKSKRLERDICVIWVPDNEKFAP